MLEMIHMSNAGTLTLPQKLHEQLGLLGEQNLAA